MKKMMIMCLVCVFVCSFVQAQATIELDKVRAQILELEKKKLEVENQMDKLFCLEDSLENDILMDVRFESVQEFDLVVPDHYNHSTYLSYFQAKYARDFERYDSNLTDEKFNKTSAKLKPGQKIKVKIIQLNENVSGKNCMAFLKKENAILVGTQGLALFYELTKGQGLIEGWFFSLDEVDNLPLGASDKQRELCREYGEKVEETRLVGFMNFKATAEDFFSVCSAEYYFYLNVYYLLSFSLEE